MAKKPTTTAPATKPADATSDWFTLDTGVIEASLPAPGDHPASIIGAKLTRTDTAAWLSIEFGLSATGEVISLLCCIACPPNSKHTSQRAQGLRRLSAILAAGGTKLGNVTDPTAIPALLIGLKMLVVIAHDKRDPIITEATIKNVKPLPLKMEGL